MGDDGIYNRVGTTSLPTLLQLTFDIRNWCNVLEHWLWNESINGLHKLSTSPENLSPILLKFLYLSRVKPEISLYHLRILWTKRRYKSDWPTLSKKLNLTLKLPSWCLCFIFPASFFCNILPSLSTFCSSHSLLFQYSVLMFFSPSPSKTVQGKKKVKTLYPHCDVCNRKVSICSTPFCLVAGGLRVSNHFPLW